MSYAVEFSEYGVKLATGIADTSHRITNITPIEGRGLSANRRLQITVVGGAHVGYSITAQIQGEDGNAVTLFDPMPFQEKA
jgi:hypothetical protein